MAQGKGAAASRKGAAARAESNGKPKEVDFRGLTLELPDKLGASVIWRAGITRDDDIGGVARLVESIIGAEKFSEVLDKMDEDGITVDDEAALDDVVDLLNRTLEVYGLSTGESPASTKS